MLTEVCSRLAEATKINDAFDSGLMSRFGEPARHEKILRGIVSAR